MRLKLGILLVAAMLTLSACGETAKTEKTEPAATNAETSADTAKKENAEKSAAEESTENPDDIWTYYNDATWTDDFNGLVSTIEKVVVSDKAPKDGNPEDLTGSAVGVKMKIENTTDKLFTTYPDQAELVTSTGEQVDASLILSDNIGGEIDEGVTKEGNVIWFLERGNAESIEWIKMKWYVTEGDGFGENDQRKEYAVKLELK